MNAEQGKQFLAALGVKVASSGSGWLRAKCPLSRYTHQKGADTAPSFGLTIDESKHSTYHCYACSTGSPESLVQALEMHSEYGTKPAGLFNFKLARDILDNEELKVIPLPEYTEFGEQTSDMIPWEESSLSMFPPAISSPVSRRYLAWRGISLAEAASYGLMVDEFRNMLVFPYRDGFGRPAGMRGRLMDFGKALFYVDKHGEKQQSLKHYDYTVAKQNNALYCWYGEEDLQEGGTVLMVEGQFDRMRLKRVFPRVLANMTAKPTARKLEKLSYADSVVLVLDNDDTGMEAAKMWVKRLEPLGVKMAVLTLDGAPKSQFHALRDGPGAPKDPDEVDENWLRETVKQFL